MSSGLGALRGAFRLRIAPVGLKERCAGGVSVGADLRPQKPKVLRSKVKLEPSLLRMGRNVECSLLFIFMGIPL
jgi:hypothetical protein